MSSSASSNKRSTWKRLPRSDPSLTSLCNRFAEISITPGEATSSSSIPNRKRSSLEAFTAASSSIEEITPRFKHSSFTNSSAPKTMVSTSTSSIQKGFKYDVFLSFRGGDTRKTFVDHLYNALKDKGIYTYKDDEKIKQGKTITNQLIQAIKDSRFFIIILSKNYASSSWCLDELVQIMDCHKTGEQTAYPVFFHVEPTEIRKQSGAVKEGFAENENKEAAGKWREAMKEASNLAGWELKEIANGHEAGFIRKIVAEISLELRSISFGFDEKLVGMVTRVKDVVSSLKMGTDDVRMIGIKGMGGAGKTTTARAVFDLLSNFEAKSFVKNVREVANGSGLHKLQEQVLSDVLNLQVTLHNVDNGKEMLKRRMSGIKVLLVLDDVDHIDQLEALAIARWFKPGSRILITTRDEQVLVAHRVNLIRDIDLLSTQEAICLFSRYAFGIENPVEGYKVLSGKVVRYAAGLPLTIKVLGSFLCGKDMDEWEDAIERLKDIPLKETLEKLELSYKSLEGDYQQIFLDIACILKGKTKEYAIRILECCGFHARNGLKVLEQRSLITITTVRDEDGDDEEYLGMHDHIEEMGKNIVRREHPDEPNKHSRLWIEEEIEDILANDMGTEATRSLKFQNLSRRNLLIVMKGLRKMKKLQYLELYPAFIRYPSVWEKPQFLEEKISYHKSSLPDSLNYLKCWDYPFLYLPKAFQGDNLVELEVNGSHTEVQLWKKKQKKVLKKLKFLSLRDSKLTTFDFRITPYLETLDLSRSVKLKKLVMPVVCQNLTYLHITETLSLEDSSEFVKLHVSAPCPNLKILKLTESRLRSLDLELIPNLEKLDLEYSKELVEINAPFESLEKVVELHLNGCALLEKLPEDLGRSGCLKNLDILDTSISHLPQSIFELKGLIMCASEELLQQYNFPSEITTASSTVSFMLSRFKRLIQECESGRNISF